MQRVFALYVPPSAFYNAERMRFMVAKLEKSLGALVVVFCSAGDAEEPRLERVGPRSFVSRLRKWKRAGTRSAYAY